MKILKLAVAAVFAVNGMATLAHAEDVVAANGGAQCACVSGGVEGQRVGSFISAKGNVLTSGGANYIKAKSGTPILEGSDISVPANGAAQVAIGTCNLSLNPGSVTRVTRLDGGNICVAPNGMAQATPAAAAPGLPIAPIVIAGAGAGLVALILVGSKNDDKPTSK